MPINFSAYSASPNIAYKDNRQRILLCTALLPFFAFSRVYILCVTQAKTQRGEYETRLFFQICRIRSYEYVIIENEFFGPVFTKILL